MRRVCVRALGALLLFLAAGCPNPASVQLVASCEKPLPQERLLAVATDEASRLLEHRLHTRGRVGHVSTPEQSAVWLVIVGFQEPTDTAAEVRVDACTGVVLSSTIGGGL